MEPLPVLGLALAPRVRPEKPSLPSRWRGSPQGTSRSAGGAPARLSSPASVTLPSACRARPSTPARSCAHAGPLRRMAASSSGEKEKERPGGGSGAAGGNSTRERLLSALEDLEVLSR